MLVGRSGKLSVYDSESFDSFDDSPLTLTPPTRFAHTFTSSIFLMVFAFFATFLSLTALFPSAHHHSLLNTKHPHTTNEMAWPTSSFTMLNSTRCNTPSFVTDEQIRWSVKVPIHYSHSVFDHEHIINDPHSSHGDEPSSSSLIIGMDLVTPSPIVMHTQQTGFGTTSPLGASSVIATGGPGSISNRPLGGGAGLSEAVARHSLNDPNAPSRLAPVDGVWYSREESVKPNYGSISDAERQSTWELIFMDRLRIRRAPFHTPFHPDEYKYRPGITAWHVLEGLDGVYLDDLIPQRNTTSGDFRSGSSPSGRANRNPAASSNTNDNNANGSNNNRNNNNLSNTKPAQANSHSTTSLSSPTNNGSTTNNGYPTNNDFNLNQPTNNNNGYAMNNGYRTTNGYASNVDNTNAYNNNAYNNNAYSNSAYNSVYDNNNNINVNANTRPGQPRYIVENDGNPNFPPPPPRINERDRSFLPPNNAIYGPYFLYTFSADNHNSHSPQEYTIDDSEMSSDNTLGSYNTPAVDYTADDFVFNPVQLDIINILNNRITKSDDTDNTLHNNSAHKKSKKIRDSNAENSKYFENNYKFHFDLLSFIYEYYDELVQHNLHTISTKFSNLIEQQHFIQHEEFLRNSESNNIKRPKTSSNFAEMLSVLTNNTSLFVKPRYPNTTLNNAFHYVFMRTYFPKSLDASSHKFQVTTSPSHFREKADFYSFLKFNTIKKHCSSFYEQYVSATDADNDLVNNNQYHRFTQNIAFYEKKHLKEIFLSKYYSFCYSLDIIFNKLMHHIMLYEINRLNESDQKSRMYVDIAEILAFIEANQLV